MKHKNGSDVKRRLQDKRKERFVEIIQNTFIKVNKRKIIYTPLHKIKENIIFSS